MQADPVVLVQTGQTFDRKSIQVNRWILSTSSPKQLKCGSICQSMQGWFSQGVTTCPVTGEQLQRIQLAPNYALKALIEQWREKQAQSGVQHSSARYPVLQARHCIVQCMGPSLLLEPEQRVLIIHAGQHVSQPGGQRRSARQGGSNTGCTGKTTFTIYGLELLPRAEDL